MTATDQAASFAAPTGPKVVRELAGLVQVPRLALQAPNLLRLPKGDRTVIAFPGFSTNDLATLPLRSALRALGHQTFGWSFGVNMAKVEDMLGDVTEMVEQRVDQTGQPAALIGWSNGGVFAREVARDRPDLVEQVITFGTPIFGGPLYTRGAALYDADELGHIVSIVDERNTIPITRPITAIYSEADNIVDWRACLDTFSPLVDNIAVSSTHAGMMIDPDILSIIAHQLAGNVE